MQLLQLLNLRIQKYVGITSIACGVLLFLVIQFFAIPGLILYVIAGILALREKAILLIIGYFNTPTWYFYLIKINSNGLF